MLVVCAHVIFMTKIFQFLERCVKIGQWGMCNSPTILHEDLIKLV